MNHLYLTRTQRVFARLRNARHWHARFHEDITETLAYLLLYFCVFIWGWNISQFFELIGS